MIDGLYDINVNVMFNKLTGTARLEARDGLVTATVEGMGMAQTATGTCEGDAFSFEGELPTPLGTMPFTLTGRVDGNVLTADCKTKLGTFKATGTRRI